eukprot:Hpha_TRINITY_DN15792_c4_g2::TRINITY_DN15792_c4_g2_i1::g.41897::m.41897
MSMHIRYDWSQSPAEVECESLPGVRAAPSIPSEWLVPLEGCNEKLVQCVVVIRLIFVPPSRDSMKKMVEWGVARCGRMLAFQGVVLQGVMMTCGFTFGKFVDPPGGAGAGVAVYGHLLFEQTHTTTLCRAFSHHNVSP